MNSLHCLMVPSCIAAAWFPHDAFARWDAGSGTRESSQGAGRQTWYRLCAVVEVRNKLFFIQE